MSDIVVSEIPKRRLSVVSGGATKYKPALSDSETTKLLQDVSSTSEMKSEVRFLAHTCMCSSKL